LFIKIIDGYRALLDFERKYNEELREYNNYLNEQANGFYRVELYKEIRREKGVMVLEYKGLKWIDKKGKVFVSTLPPQRIATKVTVPPKFPLLGIRFIIENGHVKVRYRDYRRLRELFKDYEVIEEPGLDLKTLLKDLENYAKEYLKKVSKAGFKMVLWIPLTSSGILYKIREKYGISRDRLIDVLWYLNDKGLIRFEYDGNELWISLKQ